VGEFEVANGVIDLPTIALVFVPLIFLLSGAYYSGDKSLFALQICLVIQAAVMCPWIGTSVAQMGNLAIVGLSKRTISMSIVPWFVMQLALIFGIHSAPHAPDAAWKYLSVHLNFVSQKDFFEPERGDPTPSAKPDAKDLEKVYEDLDRAGFKRVK
jgi:hypothetical protein